MIQKWKFRSSLLIFTLFFCTAISYSNAADISDITASVSTNISTQNWDALDSDYERLYLAYQDAYGPESDQALAMAKVLGQWKIQAHRDGRLSESGQVTITNASDFYSNLIERVTNRYGEDSSHLIDPLYGQAMVEYHLFQVAAAKPVSAYVGIGPETVMERQCVSIAGPESGEEGCDYIEIPNQDYIQSQRFTKSQESFSHWENIGSLLHIIHDISEANSYTSDQAEALAHLGDYHFSRSEREEAIAFYKAAYALLLDNPAEQESMQGLFGTPTIVPALSRSFPGAFSTLISDPNMVLAFNISAEGRANDMEVVGGNSANNRELSESVTNLIENSLFRPQFSESGILESQRVEMNF